MSSATRRPPQYDRTLRPPRTTQHHDPAMSSDAPPSRIARRSYHNNHHHTSSYAPSQAPTTIEPAPLTIQGALPEHYLHTRILTRTRLPDSEPIYHDIEEERQRSLSFKRQRPPRQTLTAVESSLSPDRHRVVMMNADGTPTNIIQPFRPLPQGHLRSEETEEDYHEQQQQQVENVPSDVKDTWVIYGEAGESGSVLTGLSRQELLQRREKRKDKKYGKKKKKSLILNLPLGFTRKNNDDLPKYSRGADEMSNSAASGVFRSGSRRAQLTERWARKGSRRFVSNSMIRLTQSEGGSQQQEKIPPITSRISEDLTSAMSSQSPHMNIVDYDASMSRRDGQEMQDQQMVEDWLDMSEQPIDRSIMSDESSFPYLSAPAPAVRPPRPPTTRPAVVTPRHDSSMTQSSAAASDQAVADSTSTLDDMRGQALERRINMNVFDFADNVISGGDSRLGKGEDHSTLATEVTIGNDSPTSIVDMYRGNHSSHLQHSQLTHPYNDQNVSRINTSQRNGTPAPKSILRRRAPRALITDCPSDEGSVDRNGGVYYPPRQKTVRIVFEGDEDPLAKSPPRDGSFRDDDGRELSPIQPEKVELQPALSSSVATTELTMQQVPATTEMQRVYALPHDPWYGANWPADGWRESDPTTTDLAQVREDDELSEVESEGYSCGFIEEVAAVVIQTAIRQYLAKHLVLKMLEHSLAHVRDSHFNDMTFRMYNLAAIQIQSTFRGWWVRDSLSVDHYCATLIQRIFRGFLCRTNYHFDLYRIIVIQSIWRRNAAREVAVDRLAGIMAIQAAYRGFAVRRSFDAWGLAQTEVWAATKIQTRWRGYDAQMNYLHTLADILVVQSIARVWLTKRVVVPYLRAQKTVTEKSSSVARISRTFSTQSDTGKGKNVAQLSRTFSTQSDTNKTEESSNSQHRNSTYRTVGSISPGGPRSYPNQQVRKLKANEEVESRSDGETGASEISRALRASEQQNPMAWKQLSASTSTPKRSIRVPETRYSHRVRLSSQHR